MTMKQSYQQSQPKNVNDFFAKKTKEQNPKEETILHNLLKKHMIPS
ncbi:hypothetical protein [Serratia sp. DD3]|nr:hypothetical protein [Serratia sp. DD3]KEY58407.1 hypothetical protein SRDD_26530 [Serratia sp. DD3]